jgi:hypothetical protein
MTKTQIQVPKELFEKVKSFAKRREWSLAETFRRGAEILMETYPEEGSQASTTWHPPKSNKTGWKGLSAEQLRDQVFDEQIPNPPIK